MIDTSNGLYPLPSFPENKSLSTGEVALELGVSGETVRRLIVDGELRAGRVGRRWRVLESDLRAYCRRVWA